MKICSSTWLTLVFLLPIACAEERQSDTQSTPPTSAVRARDLPFHPLKEGECIETSFVGVHARLEQTCAVGGPGELVFYPGFKDLDCGMAVDYAFGDIQKSYQTNLEVKDNWRTGDPVRVCRLDKPSKCPPGLFDPFARYLATNLRTKTSWEENNRLYATRCEEEPSTPEPAK